MVYKLEQEEVNRRKKSDEVWELENLLDGKRIELGTTDFTKYSSLNNNGCLVKWWKIVTLEMLFIKHIDCFHFFSDKMLYLYKCIVCT